MPIANALPTCISRTLGQVGFALGRKLLRKFTNLLLRLGPRFLQPARIWRESEGQIELGSGFFGERFRRSGWAKRFSFRYNAKTQFWLNAPVAQLDRVHGYEP